MQKIVFDRIRGAGGKDPLEVADGIGAAAGDAVRVGRAMSFELGTDVEWAQAWPLMVLGAILVVALTSWALWSSAKAARADDARMRDSGVHGTGTLTWVEDVSENDSAYRERIVHVDATLADGRRYEVRVYLHLKGDREPAIGDAVRVKVHPDRPGEAKLLEAPFEW
jgi:cbb3-type cytochrome oxidase subunit 3